MSDTWNSAPLAPTAPAPTADWNSAPLAGPSAQQKAVVNSGGVPDEAARAVTIAKQTNIPATVVQSDLPGYDTHARQQSAVQATTNPAIAKYIDGNPMAASISADDYVELGLSSKAINALKPDVMNSVAPLKAIARIGAEFKAGAEEGAGPQTPTAVSDEFIQGMQQLGIFHKPGEGGNPFQFFNEAMIMPVAAGINSILSALNTTLYAGAGAAGQTAVELGASQGTGQEVRRETINLANALMSNSMAVPGMRPGILPKEAAPLSVDEFLHAVSGRMTKEEIDAFLKAKPEHGPVLQITKAETGAAALEQAIEVAQDSKTKARSPETFAEFGDAHDAGSVHIDAAKVLELYQKEGKTPAEGDGLLGFVPGLAEKAQAAVATGGEVTIPVGQYIAHVDPAVHEGLKESVRLHDDGVTLEEAKEAEAAIEAWHGTPHDFERFDLTKIGMGEGAQVYGHGLYFAENKSVAGEYQKNLAPDGKLTANNISVNQSDPMALADKLDLGDARYPFSYALSSLTSGKTLPEAIALIKEQYADHPSLQKAINALNQYKPKYESGSGQLYKVSINADPTHFLDWNLPLKQQSQHVQDIIRGMAKTPAQMELLDNSALNAGESIKLGHYPGTFDINSPEFAKAYAEAGIPGIKYLDQGSRPAGTHNIANAERAMKGAQKNFEQAREAGIPADELATLKETFDIKKAEFDNLSKPTRNFVVFDDRLVKIKEKNGNPIEALVEAAIETEKLGLGIGPDTSVFMNLLIEKGEAVGITQPEFKAYSDKIARAEQAVLDKAVSVHRVEIARALTPEWKRQEAALTTEVTQEFKEQGVFAAERFLRQNKIELGGDRIDEIADSLAPLWGFESGNALRDALTNLETVQAADRKSVLVQEREAIKAEVAARMEARHGNLAENIAKEARQTALADHTFDVLADEVRLLAKLSGTTPPLTRAEMVSWAENTFEGTNIRDAANWTKLSRAVARGGRDAEKALLKGDFQEAFIAKQKQMLAATLAKQSLALQSVIDQAEKRIDKFQSSEIVAGVDQAHTEQVRQVLASVGLPQYHAPLAGTPALREFVDQSEEQIAAAPWLMDGRQPKLENMMVAEFRAFADTIKSIEHAGRQALKLENAYGEALLQNVVGDAVKALERFPFIDQPQHPSIVQRAQGVGRKIIGAHLLVERVLDYTDKFNPHGPITEWLDRPLRDANTKEIALTESIVRDLKDLRQHVDGSINDPIDNKLIPDALDKSGYLRMTRQNLRVLILNMGNWSNIKKLSEGFGVNEADLRRFIDQHATAKDTAWVNGVWKIFEKLKPEADAVQLKDTGVPVDHIPAVPWEVKSGKLDGGYYPLSYDPYNSDIQGRIAQPLFDKGYQAASTPHGYTQERTEYSGAVDLSGDFLSSKIQGMIHDIAFRLPVRNANKLISNQEFRTAMAQHWGKEVADLLPGWLRDIANSHNLDDNYSRGFVKASSLIRQNIISTLIAFNPGTFIKHGFTAAVMSADRVGLANLLSSGKDIGLTGAAKSLNDLLSKSTRVPDEAFMQAFRDSIDQGERGDNARQFVLDSSAVMRGRQRQYDETIYGAIKDITEIGVTKSLADFRQRAMLVGRLAVAFSDQMSAMPTWLTAYKKAYQEGESHADAVFIADKEMSRAHGSSFVGDRPLVSRTGNTMSGEFVRWFTSLYGFFNHYANNNFQLAWDAAAYTRGNPSGEPGANAARIAKWVGLTLAVLFIEENAGPAKDEAGHGLLGSLAFAAMRQFGAQFVGLREFTNGLGHGYEPSTGMMGTLSKAVVETSKDLGRASGVKAGLSKNTIRNTATSIGFLTGVGGSQVGRTGQFAYEVATGRDQPRTFNDYRQGLRTGHSKARRPR